MQYVRCIGENVNIRAGAGTEYSVIGTAKKGTMYAIIGKIGSWYKTYYRNQVAYLSSSYFSVVRIEKSKNSKIEKVLDEGYKLIGVPYVYGAVRVHDGYGNLLKGFSTQKFDCSSLVQYVFYKGANKLLQVHTRTQVKQGTYVKPSELRRGDCIFFTNEDRQYNTGVEKIGHVAIYLGNDYILHTASDYARIEKMNAYRWNFYVEARRFI
jgi:cell wall-associated NlpC family hydrolase